MTRSDGGMSDVAPEATSSAPAASVPQRKFVLRKLRLLVHLAEGIVTCALLFWWIGPRAKQALIQRWSRKLLALFRVSLVVRGETADAKDLAGSMLVSNHVSWLDIYAINSWHPPRFVAKSEIRSWPVIGWLCAQTGVLFVERARKRDAHRIMHAIADAMRAGDVVCVFPEGTTSSGLQLLPFHANLFQAPVTAGAPIRPLALRYRVAATGELTTIPAYIDDLTLLDSVNAILNGPPLVVEVFVGAAMAPEMDRRALAAHSEQAVAALIHRAG
ncbi:lysophospholipid acyltransferase family protein [Ralstonia mannitolilytica]|uniref:1-acyl-sn-glycerol-3-phosphate acyltransferase n=1 Tax=Ralstonia mannitolilytica TaxID=105219 RepID=A0AAJ4ZJN9_9RALS|nr:lysophospholipid acyltransferase family protein [Ralstonia mannitolilytica]CAG2151465.1 1-acyl-sn-glycerol-3-phosphate acyltransferase [Ralstonia mannitolilytica]CAJ0731245.1 1-acyl-sn-glycerol-3-phosphate acyltransferase [Ralstonia mannitolilytica]SUD86982.1 1-acyl-sn-glycerol-3-phosphate acyltransferase [Ralstonia mannitolilytica]SUD92905.1 1-acyl-sn-glycerol-3-phosphate acyltransferase [Ralstonia mannitolilytica]SUD96643.1 1-acyl-sn-glycerol-3-phosphate acyltransferase [Ralstonia mannito